MVQSHIMFVYKQNDRHYNRFDGMSEYTIGRTSSFRVQESHGELWYMMWHNNSRTRVNGCVNMFSFITDDITSHMKRFDSDRINNFGSQIENETYNCGSKSLNLFVFNIRKFRVFYRSHGQYSRGVTKLNLFALKGFTRHSRCGAGEEWQESVAHKRVPMKRCWEYYKKREK